MRRLLTENSHLRTKVRIRVDYLRSLETDRVSVLDAFAGEGKVWAEVQKQLPDTNVTYLGIDKKKYARPDIIMGNNQKVMRGLELDKFDLIDLDAFGCPWEQLAICADKAPSTPVVSTCIFVTLAPVPRPLLEVAGIPEEWTTELKAPQALFARWRWDIWENYCARLGYKVSNYELHLDKSAVKRYELLM